MSDEDCISQQQFVKKSQGSYHWHILCEKCLAILVELYFALFHLLAVSSTNEKEN